MWPTPPTWFLNVVLLIIFAVPFALGLLAGWYFL